MTWIQIAGGCVAAAAIVLGLLGVVRALRETDSDRALTYARGSSERRALERTANGAH